jgi:hypothetical protein
MRKIGFFYGWPPRSVEKLKQSPSNQRFELGLRV